MSKIELPESVCPYCDYVMDSAFCTHKDVMPVPGDVSICMSCAQLLIFDDNLTSRKATPEEESKMGKDPRVQQAQQAVRKLDRTKMKGYKHG